MEWPLAESWQRRQTPYRGCVCPDDSLPIPEYFSQNSRWRKNCSFLPDLYGVRMTDSAACLGVLASLPPLVPSTSIPPHRLLLSDAYLPHMEEAMRRSCSHSFLNRKLYKCARSCLMLYSTTTPFPHIVLLR